MSWLPDFITGYDAENDAAADAKLAEVRAEYAAAGKPWQEPVADSWTPGSQADRDSIDAEFQAGLADGAGNITGFVSGTFKFVGKALGAVLLGVPVWAWLLAGVGAFLYFGGAQIIRKKLA